MCVSFFGLSSNPSTHNISGACGMHHNALHILQDQAKSVTYTCYYTSSLSQFKVQCKELSSHILCGLKLTIRIYMFQTQNDMLVVSHVAHILEQVVPKIEHPSESFMRELEEDLVKLIMKHGQMVNTSCIFLIVPVYLMNLLLFVKAIFNI